MSSTDASRTTWPSCAGLKNVGRGTTILPANAQASCAMTQPTPFGAQMPIVCGRPLRSAARAVTLARSSRRDNRPCRSLMAIDSPAADAWRLIESNSRRIPLLALKTVTARFQTPAGNGVYFWLAGIIGPPSLGIGDALAVGVTQKGRCDA